MLIGSIEMTNSFYRIRIVIIIDVSECLYVFFFPRERSLFVIDRQLWTCVYIYIYAYE